MWLIVVALQLSSSYAQLTPLGEAVTCEGRQVVFVCQQAYFTRWTVFLSGGNRYTNTAFPSQATGTVLPLQNDTSFGFEIHVLSSSSNTTVLSELRVTAVRQLNGSSVECSGASGTHTSTIQIESFDPPAAPSGVMTSSDQSQFTPSTASITLTWSASSGADNYTIMVAPLLPSGQFLVSTTTTSLQLTVLYNNEYSINITAQNCAGSNSTLVQLGAVGCSSPSPLANGRISKHSNGAVGAMLTFQCDTGYLPQEEVTSTCLSNSSWVPTPECQGGPLGLYIGISAAVVCLIILSIALVVAVLMVKKRQGVREKTQSFNLDTHEYEDDQQYAQTRHLGPRAKNQAGEEQYSVLDHNILTEVPKTPLGRGDTLIYADLGPSSGKRRTPVISNIQDDHRVVYSTVSHALQQQTKKRKSDKGGPCPADAALDLDMLLIQLKPQVLTKWKQFAEAVGLSNIIKELSQYSEDECIVEVFDQWLKSHPTKPTWRNVADVLNDIGLQQLAKDILKVYQTGKLPIVVDMDAVPEMTSVDTETPPPLPPKIDDDDLVPPTRPPKPISK